MELEEKQGKSNIHTLGRYTHDHKLAGSRAVTPFFFMSIALSVGSSSIFSRVLFCSVLFFFSLLFYLTLCSGVMQEDHSCKGKDQG
jgi:hypothetical protein